MPSPEEMFEHMYRDGLRDLERNRDQNKLDLQYAKSSADTPRAHVVMIEQYDYMIDDVIKSLTVERPAPELVLKNGLTALRRIEQFRFLLENLLEAVKRDDSLQNSLIRYSALGLIDFPVSDLSEVKRQSPWPFNSGAGGVLTKLWGRLRNAALTLMELVTNAINRIPQLISVKPKASIGVSGPFPTFSLQLEIETESIALHELFRVLTGE